MNARRLRIVVLFLLCALTTVLVRSAQVMVAEHARWQRRARAQHERILRVPGPRGSIRSADGYLLAASIDRLAIQVDTRRLAYPRLFAAAAASLLGRPAAELERRLRNGAHAVWLAKRVDQALATTVRELDPGAVVLVPDWERVYPLAPVAAPLVGFAGREELRTVGRSGLEHYFDELLAGEPEEYLAVADAIQRQISLERVHRGRAGYDLELTLDARLQAACERQLARTVEACGAVAASAVVLEPSTGDILALASLPSFDPGDPAASPPSSWRLRPVQDAIEPGSTAKPFVAAVALADGVIGEGERFDCRHHGVRVAGRWIRDHADPGSYTIDEVVAHSSNAGIVTVAERLTPEALYGALSAFGFGRRTDVGFPAEAAGILRPAESWSALSRAGLALGEELTVTPLQLAVAYAAIANGGWLVRPTVVRRRTGAAPASAPNRRRARVVDAALASRLRAMLEETVERGTGEAARVAGYRVAGKTGTAQRATVGGFDDEHHVAWFAGFLPLPEPRWVIVVTIEDPAGDYWASSIAAPTFARIASAATRLVDLAPRFEETEYRPADAGGRT